MPTKTGELREMLISAISDLREGKLDASQASAVAKLASAVTASLQVEINAMRELRALGGMKVPLDVGSLALGETEHLPALTDKRVLK